MYLRQQYGYKWDPVKRERVFCWPDPGHPTWTIITDLETGKRIELLKEECLDTDGNDITKFLDEYGRDVRLLQGCEERKVEKPKEEAVPRPSTIKGWTIVGNFERSPSGNTLHQLFFPADEYVKRPQPGYVYNDQGTKK